MITLNTIDWICKVIQTITKRALNERPFLFKETCDWSYKKEGHQINGNPLSNFTECTK